MLRFDPTYPYQTRFFKIVPDWATSRIEPLHLRGAMPRDACEEVVRINSEDKKQWILVKPPHRSGVKQNLNYRNNFGVVDPDYTPIADYMKMEYLGEQINKAWGYPDYKYEFIPERKLVGYTVFKRGEYCRNHEDVVWDGTTLLRQTRRFTVLHYFNDCVMEPTEGAYTGGELLITSMLTELNQVYMIRPKAGDIVIFPANANYGHAVHRVLSGVRHNSVQFLKFTHE